MAVKARQFNVGPSALWSSVSPPPPGGGVLQHPGSDILHVGGRQGPHPRTPGGGASGESLVSVCLSGGFMVVMEEP